MIRYGRGTEQYEAYQLKLHEEHVTKKYGVATFEEAKKIIAKKLLKGDNL